MEHIHGVTLQNLIVQARNALVNQLFFLLLLLLSPPSVGPTSIDASPWQLTEIKSL